MQFAAHLRTLTFAGTGNIWSESATINDMVEQVECACNGGQSSYTRAAAIAIEYQLASGHSAPTFWSVSKTYLLLNARKAAAAKLLQLLLLHVQQQ